MKGQKSTFKTFNNTHQIILYCSKTTYIQVSSEGLTQLGIPSSFCKMIDKNSGILCLGNSRDLCCDTDA